MAAITEALGFMPTPGSMLALEYGEAAYKFAAGRCPLLRTLTRYVRYHASGSSSGGGQNGLTPSTAYRVRHLADARTLALSVLVTGMALLFRDGDEFRLDLTNATTVGNSSMDLSSLTFGDFTIGRYSDAAVANVTVTTNNNNSAMGPKFLGSELYAAGGWTNDATYTNCWYRDPPNPTTIPVYCVKWAEVDPIDGAYAGLGPQTFRIYGGTANTLGATGGALTTALTAMNAADEDSFVRDSSTGRIYVRPRAAKAATINTTARIEGIVSTTFCFKFPDQDGIRLDGTTEVGWGMNSVASQLYCQHFVLTGSKIALVTGTTSCYTGHHCVGLLRSGSGPVGGAVVWRNCRAGFCDGDSLGNATAWINFNNDGRNEAVYSCCELVYGNLKTPRTGTPTTPVGSHQAWYAHGGVGGPTGSPLMVCIDRCVISKRAVDDGGSRVSLGGADLGIDSDPTIASTWQCRATLCRQPDGPLSVFNYTGYLMLCATVIEASFESVGYASVSQIPFCMISSIVHMNGKRVASANLTFNTLSGVSIGGTWKGKAHHYYSSSRVSWECFGNQNVCVYDRFTIDSSVIGDANKAYYCQAWNSEFLGSAASRKSNEPHFVGMYDGAPTIGGQGGMQNCVFANVQKTTLGAFAPNPMRGWDLSGSPSYSRMPTLGAMSPTSESFASTQIPAAPWLKPEYDVNGNLRLEDVAGPFSRKPDASAGGNCAVAVPAPSVMAVGGRHAKGMRTSRGGRR